MVVLDVDGVLTDGRIVYDDRGREYKFFDAHDGFGISRARELGLKFAIITGRQSPAVSRRAKELGIRDVFQSASDKLAVLRKLRSLHSLNNAEICGIGDDEPDIPFLKAVGVSAAPASAVGAVKEIVDLVTKKLGGRGAVRELIDRILRAQKLL